MAKNTTQISGVKGGPGKNLGNLKPPFKKGQSGNPNGRPKGRRNFSTLFDEAIRSIAEKNGTTPNDIEEKIVLMGVKKALGGDYRFYQDIQDRLHGKPRQVTEITGADGKDLIPDDGAVAASNTLVLKYLTKIKNGRTKRNTKNTG